MHPGPEPPDGAKQAQPKQLQVLKLLGMEIPLPPWAVAVVAAIAIIGVAVVILCWILPHINGDQQLRETLANKQRELDEKEKQLQEKQKALERESVDVSAEIQFKESQKHAGEPGRQLYHQPTLHVAWYPDDGCVLVKRFGDNNINPARWILDPARIPTQPLPTPAGPIKGAARQPEQYPRPLIRVNMQTGQKSQPCKGRCKYPHPGTPKTSTVKRGECWVQIWNKWPDGCTQYQYYNSCYSYWDTDQNKKPRINWTCCTH